MRQQESLKVDFEVNMAFYQLGSIQKIIFIYIKILVYYHPKKDIGKPKIVAITRPL